MTFVTHARVGLVAAAAALLPACGGNEVPEMRAVLTDDGCTYHGDRDPGAGAISVEIDNQSSIDGAFALAGITEDAAIADLERYMEEERRRNERGETLRGPPAFYSQIVRVAVASGARSRLPADLLSGRYALMCFIDDPPVWRVYLAAQFEPAP